MYDRSKKPGAKRLLAGLLLTALRPLARVPPFRRAAWDFMRGYIGHYGIERVAKTTFGAQLHCSSQDLVQSSILLFGQWEPALTEFLAGRLKPGDVFVDVGANVGYFTILASSLVGAAGSVVAIDSSLTNYTALRRNTKLNASSNVREVHAAVMSRRDVVSTYRGDPGNCGHASVLPQYGTEVEGSVEAFPLADLVTSEEWQRMRVIKIDVEGAEADVLEGILAGPPLPPQCDLVVEVNPEWLGVRGKSALELIAGFTRQGYSIYELDRSPAWESRGGPLLQISEVPTSRVADLVLTRDLKRV